MLSNKEPAVAQFKINPAGAKQKGTLAAYSEIMNPAGAQSNKEPRRRAMKKESCRRTVKK